MSPTKNDNLRLNHRRGACVVRTCWETLEKFRLRSFEAWIIKSHRRLADNRSGVETDDDDIPHHIKSQLNLHACVTVHACKPPRTQPSSNSSLPHQARRRLKRRLVTSECHEKFFVLYLTRRVTFGLTCASMLTR